MTMPQRPERIRIVGPDGEERIITIPPIPAEDDRVEFDQTFANDDESSREEKKAR